MSRHFSMVAVESRLNQIFFMALTALSLQQPIKKPPDEIKKNLNLNPLQRSYTSLISIYYTSIY